MKNDHQEFYPSALAVGGSDSGGGDGIQADLRTFNAAGVFGCSVITSVAAQNPHGTVMQEAVSPQLVKAQYEAVTSAIAVRVIKTGVLANAEIIAALCQALNKKSVPLITAPTMFTEAGAPLLNKKALQAMKEDFLLLADMILLNLPEAEYLLDSKLSSEADHLAAAEALAQRYQSNILLQTSAVSSTGKLTAAAVLEKKTFLLSAPRVADLSEFASHGYTGTFASAAAAMLAVGNSWRDAVKFALAYVCGSLNESAPIGKDIDAMYPPLEDYTPQVTMRSAGNQPRQNKGKSHA